MKRSTSRMPRIIAALLSFLFIVALLFFSLRLTINSEGFYTREFEKLKNNEAMGMSQDDLLRSTMQMINYMEGRAPSIDIIVHVNAVEVSMFNDREAAHMADVQRLYQGWRTASFCFLIAYALFFAIWFLRVRGGRAFLWSRAFLQASRLFGVLIVLLVLFALIDFSSFWTAFHHVFFTNELWILNPATDRMIAMMPLAFFYDIVLRILVTFLIPFALLLALAIYALRRSRKQWMRNSRDALRRAAEQHILSEARRIKED